MPATSRAQSVGPRPAAAQPPAPAPSAVAPSAKPASDAKPAEEAAVARAVPAAGGAEARPLRFRSCICACTGWQAALFAADVYYHTNTGRVPWGLALGLHAALAALASVMTGAEGDYGIVPFIGGRIDSSISAARAALGKPLGGLFGSHVFILFISLYLSAFSVPLILASGAPWSPYMWCSVLSHCLCMIVHAANFVYSAAAFVYSKVLKKLKTH
ncbi:unnamed protein product [Prorocentrum cordatum]|uniref:Uncharacterized protein n=1 Tax=Prorocentrum cordatum TaxID=2364126 RepID=A0ABN9U579_9DINO|nr:unnamed protein product [Polarella glacialis]